MSGPEQYVFIAPVWGDVYVERFIKLSLPTQLTPGNLGAMPADRARYLIYTRGENARAILRSRAYRRLKQMLPVSVLSLDDLPDPTILGNPHELQTAAFTRGIAAARSEQTAFVFLTPDTLVGEGSFRHMVELTEAGKRVLMVASIRMTADGAAACVARHRTAARDCTPIASRDLIRSCLDNMHAITAGHVVAQDRVYAAQHMYWKVGDHGLVVRGFHLHPLLVWPRDPSAAITNTLDDQYIARACPERADWHTVADSDDLCLIEFTERNQKLDFLAPQPLSDRAVVKFIMEGTTPDHREHVAKRIRLHAGDVDPAEWQPLEAASDAFVDRYLDLFAKSPPVDNVPGTTTIQDRLDAIFGTASPDVVVEKRASLARRIARALTVPMRVAYRRLNFKLYAHLRELQAEVKTLREILHHTRQYLQITMARQEDLFARMAEASRVKAARQTRDLAAREAMKREYRAKSR